ncbi:beta-galactosidase [Oceanimonas sp. CHS3-5]|uniref:beta-galactosidase n=1 Tax=Oceanimonas sp. CHS3-5 TaxID=3068186 RepID=UPI00273D9813|nr:beta-galactosidase [Oceanimonas sp. CHS3-5]MDP5292526.1 beta-galactosidase [Oceanimonas sp. CHS3-5]
MVDGLDVCPSALKKEMSSQSSAAEYCFKVGETSAGILKEKLNEFGPKISPSGSFSIGYTLPFPLLSYVDFDESGSFSIDEAKVAHRLKLLKETDRDVVLYLFYNHFSTSYNAVVESEVARLDPDGLMQLADGSIPIDGYFSNKTYPWVINDPDALINKIRVAAIDEVMNQLCDMNQADIDKVRALTVLGELHHIYPDFFNGMSFRSDFLTTDYSPATVARFQQYLQDEYGSIQRLNEVFDAVFTEFEDIYPPSKNINSEPLESFFQHVDYSSSGILTLHGWAVRKDGKPVNIKIYVDGQFAGNAEYGLNRMDVYQAKLGSGHAAVGYRYLLDIKSLEAGVHTVDIVYNDNGRETLLKTLEVPVMGRSQATPKLVSDGLNLEQEKSLDYWHDYPKSMQPVFYNLLSLAFYEFRKKAVSEEVERYSRQAGSFCLEKSKVFSHQIAPVFNSDWSEEKLAVSDTFKKNEYYQLGFNAYGAAFYSDYTFSWLQEKGVELYGMPEVHAMLHDEEMILKALKRHNAEGAVFISPYYVEIKPGTFKEDEEHSKFKVESGNAAYHSDSFFRAVAAVMVK